jgi:hypothetical protein
MKEKSTSSTNTECVSDEEINRILLVASELSSLQVQKLGKYALYIKKLQTELAECKQEIERLSIDRKQFLMDAAHNAERCRAVEAELEAVRSVIDFTQDEPIQSVAKAVEMTLECHAQAVKTVEARNETLKQTLSEARFWIVENGAINKTANILSIIDAALTSKETPRDRDPGQRD